MIKASLIRKEARSQLKGKYWTVFRLTLLSALFTFALNFILNLGNQRAGLERASGSVQIQNYLVNIISFFLTSGTTGGIMYFSRERLPKDAQPFTFLFRFLKAPYAGGIFLTGIFVMLLSILWAIPAGIGVAALLLGDFSGNSALVILGVVLLIAGIFFLFYKTFSYALSINALIDIIDEKGRLEKATEAINKSKDLMRGHIFQLIILNLSFIGWWILAVLPLGLGVIFLIPYVSLSNVLFYRQLAEK